MKIIKMFLASSLDELRDDRRKFSEFIGDLNDELIEHDIYIRLIMCEHDDMTMAENGKQPQLDQKICDSELAVFLFFKKIGEYTNEEFDVAYKHFPKTECVPNILVFFREDLTEPTPQIATFQLNLTNEKGIEYITYSEFDTVEQNILLWVRDYLTQEDCWKPSVSQTKTDRTYINIMFACSAEDLQEDSSEIKGFFRELNDRYVEHNMYFRLIRFENEGMLIHTLGFENNNERRIEEKDSELFIVVFFKTADNHVLEKFNEAYECFKEYKKPSILTFFRTDGSDPSDEVQEFMDRLDKQLGHYFKFYGDTDTLKLYVLMQILNMNLDSTIEFQDGQAYVAGDPILSLDHLPELANNVDLKKLQEKIEEAEQEYIDSYDNYRKEENDYNKRAKDEAQKRLDELKTQKKQTEKAILEMTQQAVEDCVKGDLTHRHKLAIRLMEQGDSRAAFEVYDMDDICADFDEIDKGYQQAQDMIENMKVADTACVNDILEKIKLLKMDQDREPLDICREAMKYYEVAIKREREHDLDRVATRKYVYDLYSWGSWGDLDRGEQVARQYVGYAYGNGNQDDIREAETLLALILQSTDEYNRMIEAEALFQKLLATCHDTEEEARLCQYLARGLERRDWIEESTEHLEEIIRFRQQALNNVRELMKKDKKAFDEWDLATFCMELGESLERKGDPESIKEAETLEREGDILNLKMAQRDPVAFESHPYYRLENLVRSLPKDCDEVVLNEAEAYFRAKLKISRDEAKNGPAAFKFNLALDCYFMAEFLIWYRDDPESRTETERLYNEALDAEYILAQNGMSSSGEYLATQYSELAEGLGKKDSTNQVSAEDLYREALKIRRGLANKVSPDFKTSEAYSCSRLACFLGKKESAESQEEAEDLYKEALEIRRELAWDGSIQSKANLAFSCNDLANFLAGQEDAESQKEAEDLYREALEIRRELAGDGSLQSKANLAFSCNDLANFLAGRENAENQKEAEKLYREALKILRGIAKENQAYEESLAFSCNALAYFLQKQENVESQKETESLYREALEIRRSIKESPPVEFFKADENLAFSCTNLARFLENRDEQDIQQEVEGLYREALDIRRDLLEKNPTIFGDWDETAAKNNLCLSCTYLALFLDKQRETKDLEEIENLYREALDIRREIAKDWKTEVNQLNVAFSCNYLAAFLGKSEDIESLQEAENLYREALAISREVAKKRRTEVNQSNVALRCNDFAVFLAKSDDIESLQEAEDLYREALTIRRQIEGDNFSDYNRENLAFSCTNLALFLDNQKEEADLEEVESLYREALEIRREIANERQTKVTQLNVASSCNNLACFLGKSDDIERLQEAEDLYREALEIQEEIAMEDLE